MLACSSIKPFARCHPEVALNQRKASHTWQTAFSRIIYFNSPEPDVDGKTIEFIEGDDPPRIKTLVEQCAKHPGWSCIINADIQVGNNFSAALDALKQADALCAMSRRYEVVEGDYTNAQPVDLGLDFFAATQSAWGAVAADIPETFVIGKVLWDYWLNNYFAELFSHAYYDLTPSRFIFHPRHGYRGDQCLDIERDRYMVGSRWPRHKISVDCPVKRQ